jgi:hypothetical protein
MKEAKEKPWRRTAAIATMLRLERITVDAIHV